MHKLDEAKQVLKEIGMPEQQQTDVAAYTLLTLLHICPNDSWKDATNYWIRIHDVLLFCSQHYNKVYAENSRETIRKQCMHHFRKAALIEDNGEATNSPNYRYRITKEALSLIKTYNTDVWQTMLNKYLEEYSSLVEKYASKKRMQMMPVKINGNELNSVRVSIISYNVKY